MGLKVKELRLLRKLYLPYGLHNQLFRNLRLSKTVNQRISMFKYGYATRIKEEGNSFAAFAYLWKASLSDFSFLYYLDKIFQKTQLRK